jgi:hypothetical protein
MTYVVKAVSNSGVTSWICPSKVSGFKSLGDRDLAEVFPTRAQAYGAIYSVPNILHPTGVSYSVEAVGQSAAMPSF